MSDIKRKFLLRMPSALYDALEMQAVQLNMSLNSLIVQRLSDAPQEAPKAMAAAERTRRIAATLPNTMSGAEVPQPKHNPDTCRIYGCLLCAEAKR